MIYSKKDYDFLKQGFPYDPDESTASRIKTSIENGRIEYFLSVINYLEENKIPYEQLPMRYDIKVKDMIVRTDMKVQFDTGKKLYQYNYTKAIKRITENE